jgi:segregation and condensation protein B
VTDVPKPEVDEAAPDQEIAEGSGRHDAHELADAMVAAGEHLDGEAPEHVEPDVGAEGEAVADDVEAGASEASEEVVAAALATAHAAPDSPATRVSDTARLEAAMARLGEELAERGVVLAQVSGGYQLRTASRFASWVQQLIAGRPVRLSRAQLETLAIVAYRQPITRPEIDDIRGVDSSNTLRVLAERQLVRVLGKREEVGRPLLYGTTKEFLDFFSLADLRELPTLREYSELTAENREVMEARLAAAEDEAETASES